MQHRSLRLILALALVLGMASGCGSQPQPSPTTPAFATEEEAFAAAEETYRAYVDSLNEVDLSDPATFEGVYAWTTGEFNAGERRTLSEMHANGWVVTGATVIKRLERLTLSEPEFFVQLGSCVDVSAVALVDASGQSQVASDRPVTQSTKVNLIASPSSATGFLVDAVSGYELEPPCQS